MTTITVELPDDLAARAKREGLLTPLRLQALLEQALADMEAASPAQQAILARTRGLWRHGDGLEWQRQQRSEWERNTE